MKLKELLDFVIQCGIEADPRDKREIQQQLKENKKNYDKLESNEKSCYDMNKLTSPYADSRILYGDGGISVKSILIGIDIDGSELLLADRLRQHGKKVDLAMSHHPAGRAYATFYQVMNIQPELVNKFGVPINAGEGLMEPRMKEVWRRVMAQNHNRPVDFARILDIPYMCCHTPADNHVAEYLQKLFDKAGVKKIGDIIDLLMKEPEYRQAAAEMHGPEIIVGSKEKKAGRVFVDMTGGTEGPVKYIEKLADSGIGTLVGMHYSEGHIKEAEKNNINVVIAGHISSDTLGLNLLLDKVQKKFGDLQFTGCSGFQRFRRGK